MTDLIVGGVKMHQGLPYMMGGGVCKFVHQLEPYLRKDLPCGALELGSITPAFREGNQGSPQWPESYEELRQYKGGVNAWSMPNAGFKGTATLLSHIESPPPIVANIAGFTPNDFAEGVEKFEKLPQVVATISNWGCPNTENLPVSYDLKSMIAILDMIRTVNPTKPVWVKLSPYVTEDKISRLIQKLWPLRTDFSEVPTAPEGFLKEVLEVLLAYPFVKAVILFNTLGNVRIFDPETDEPVLKVNDGKGGLSGDLLRVEVALPAVKQAAAFLGNRLDVIACGGAFEGDHIVHYLNAGAKLVQCTSGSTWGGGSRFFQHLIEGSEALQNYLYEAQG